MVDTFKNKTVLVIGGTGTIGHKITSLILQQDPKAIRVFSRDEHKQFMMQQEFGKNEKLRFLIGDVRDYEQLERATRGVDIIFHLAAMKHVPICEYNPDEAVKTNVMGTQHVIEAAIGNKVSRVILSSSDKAISPTNAMGATKLLAERLIINADYYKGPTKTVFSAVRFGNVLGSRGSVIPLFVQQIMEKRMITITDKEMTRFIMSIEDAAKLTMKSCLSAVGGEMFILKMPMVKLKDLAALVVQKTCKKYDISPEGIEVKEIGLRPGEKRFEELMTIEESETAYDLGDMFAVTPIFHEKDYAKFYATYPKAEHKTYGSDDGTYLSLQELSAWIDKENLI